MPIKRKCSATRRMIKRKCSAARQYNQTLSSRDNHAQQIADLEFSFCKKKDVTAAEKEEFAYKLRRIKNSMSAMKSRERKRKKILKMEWTLADLRTEVKRLETENMQIRKKLIQQQRGFKMRSLNQTTKHSPDSPHYPNKRPQTDGSSRFIPSTNSARMFSEHSEQYPLHSCQNERPQSDGSSRFIPSANSARIFSEHSEQYPLHYCQNELPQTDGSSKFIPSTNLDRVFSEQSKQLNPVDLGTSASCESKHPHDDSSDLLGIDDYDNDFLSDLNFLDDLTNFNAMDSVLKAIEIPNENSPAPTVFNGKYFHPSTFSHHSTPRPRPASPGFDFDALKSSRTQTVKPLPVSLPLPLHFTFADSLPPSPALTHILTFTISPTPPRPSPLTTHSHIQVVNSDSMIQGSLT